MSSNNVVYPYQFRGRWTEFMPVHGEVQNQQLQNLADEINEIANQVLIQSTLLANRAWDIFHGPAVAGDEKSVMSGEMGTTGAELFKIYGRIDGLSRKMDWIRRKQDGQ